MREIRDYTDFDKFIRAKIKDGKITVPYKERQLKEELFKLGIRRVANIGDDGRRYVNNAYPKQSQLDHVKLVIDREHPKQERIDKSKLYRKDDYGYRADNIIFWNNK